MSVLSSLIVVLPALLASALNVNKEHASDSAGNRYTVVLHRQRVPVRSDDAFVSFKSIYFGNIHLGGPKSQTFSMVFDSGSGHLIVPSTACLSETCAIHRRFDSNLSTTAIETDMDGNPIKPHGARDHITVAFGTGEVTGSFVQDRVCLNFPDEPSDANVAMASNPEADAPEASMLERYGERHGCVDLRIVAATDMAEEPFASFSFDGVLGLGLGSLALSPEFSFFEMMTRQANLARPIFGVFLADNDDDFSEIDFGGFNPERVTSEIKWAPVAIPEFGYWQVKITAVRVGNRTFDFCNDGQCRAVVDTGTSLLAVPGAFAQELQDSLESSLSDGQAGRPDCKSATGEILEFDFEGGTLTLNPGDYARPAINLAGTTEDEESQIVEAAVEAGDRGEPLDPKLTKCHPTIMPIEMPEPVGPKLFIWGEPVLRKYYTAYDWQNKMVGFALAAQMEAAAPAEVQPEVTPLLFL
eukprot:CAMPEP_0170607342 /NCGR_PEP_ID=MMETSP0224-20130122/21003_1 /TAXON_ID=285029 /ORGANISM="Togula jolla, Strain CCCM 725" /LENGTH=469 /DNA_ID=CAMNT_0010932501 /DNA_START=109 /DNA_END=1518 /DNA_ORIENTATION=-